MFTKSHHKKTLQHIDSLDILKKKTQQKKIDTKKNSKARGEKRGRIQVSTKENKQQKKKRKI